MKTTNKLKVAILALITQFSLFSCKEDSTAPSSVDSPAEKTISFMGETVRLPDDLPEELLTHSAEDFGKYYNSFLESKGVSSARYSADQSKWLSYQEVSDLITPLLKNYPDLSIEKEISKEDQKRIFTDFKSIKSLDEIREKADIIIAY